MAQTQQVARELEVFLAVLGRIAGMGEIDLQPPVRAHIFRKGDSSFASRSAPAGQVIQDEERTYIVLDATREPESLTAVRHDLVHAVLRNASRLRYPVWYSEGLADLLSTAVVDGPDMVVGDPPLERATQLVYGNSLSFERLLTAKAIRGWSGPARHAFLMQAWALTHFLHLSWRLLDRDRHPDLLRYLSRLNEGAAPLRANTEANDESIEDLRHDFDRYVTARTFPVGRIPVPSHIPAAAERIEKGRRLSAADALTRLAALALSIRNRTTHEDGRAVRTFADGTFDAYLPLTEGVNEIEVCAKLAGGRTLREIRTLQFERSTSPCAEDERPAEEQREALRRRTAETELMEEMRRRREERRRNLEIEISPGDASNPETPR